MIVSGSTWTTLSADTTLAPWSGLSALYLVPRSPHCNVNISRLEYELLSNFLVDKRGKLSSSLYLIVFYYISGLI